MAKLPTPNAGAMQSAPGYSTRTRNKRPTVKPVGKVAVTPGFTQYADVPGADKGAPKEGSRTGIKPQSV